MTRDPVSADLARYEREQAQNELECEEAERLAQAQAKTDVNDPEVIRELINQWEMEPAYCLARCFANLGRAYQGEHIAVEAIIEALHYLRRDMIAKQADILFNEKLDQIRGE
jgi:hypothetical protein